MQKVTAERWVICGTRKVTVSARMCFESFYQCIVIKQALLGSDAPDACDAVFSRAAGFNVVAIT